MCRTASWISSAGQRVDFLPYDGKLTVGATFNIGATPGGPGGGGSLSTVNVTLHGANDPVIITGDIPTFLNVALHGTVSGSFTATDADWYPDGQTVVFVPHNPTLHGSMGGGTSWFYGAEFGPDTQAPHDDVWDIVVHDNFGSVVTHTLDFHLI